MCRTICIWPDSTRRAIIVAVIDLVMPAQVPAIADLKPYAAPLLPLSVGRRSDDLAVDHHHRGEANEILLLTKADDQIREWGFGVFGVS